ncbi:hypothetical protein D3C76_1483490 [compost metagenome]
MSITVSIAILDPIAPLRIVTSGVEMPSKISALSASSLLLYLVMAMVQALFFLAISNASKISIVSPELETNMATFPLLSNVAAVSILCPSVYA